MDNLCAPAAVKPIPISLTTACLPLHADLTANILGSDLAASGNPPSCIPMCRNRNAPNVLLSAFVDDAHLVARR